ncbi:MAG: hypothetical protein IJS45_04005 [Clostridia bacterium]|nr:hypothetical protein [Clostridia bacterium]
MSTRDDTVVYSDEKYVLGRKGGIPYLKAGGEKYKLSCHPYEPCLYITGENGAMTAVHNAFDPSSVLQAFSRGMTVTSITGFEYDAKDFCKMVEYAAGMVNIGIDDAEKSFGGRAKKKRPEITDNKKEIKMPSVDGEKYLPGSGRIIKDDPFYGLIAGYPDCVIDYCLVENENITGGCDSHRFALVRACRRLFFDDDGEAIWHYDAGKADAKRISVDELLAPVSADGEKLNYRKAFLAPPYPNNCKDEDFDKINATLFPNGTDGLEVYEWTTNWSEYFDEGNEWWGALCLSVYDKSLDRFVVIMASATD